MSVPLLLMVKVLLPLSAKPTARPRKHSDRVSAPLVGPVLGRVEGPRGLGVVRRLDVVVLHRHRLLAAMDDRLLGKRGGHVADLRAALAVGQAVDPGVVDAVVVSL